jgi:glyoxylase-like metal-dependent hydrolase (beta-lactamase superfamily II)
MLKRTLATVTIMGAVLSAQSFDVQKIADGVYAAIVRQGAPVVGSNGAFVVCRDHVLVVDTHYRPSVARELLAEIKKVTPLPVRYVVNTHWHNDHTQGNQAYFNVFPKGVEFLSHTTARRDIQEKAIPSIKDSLKNLPGQIQKLEAKLAGATNEQDRAQLRRLIEGNKAYLAELQNLEITLPTLTFDRSLILFNGDREIRVLHFGRGHTAGDVVVYLPKEKVVVTGDLLTSGIPFFRDAYPSEWAATLKGISGLEIDRVVPGHGPVQEGKTQLSRLIAYLDEMVPAVRKLAAEGKTLDQVKAALDFSKYKDQLAGFQPPLGNTLAIERTYLEATGKVQ